MGRFLSVVKTAPLARSLSLARHALACALLVGLLVGCSSSKRAQSSPTPEPSTGATWQSAKVKPPRKPLLSQVREKLSGPSAAKQADDARLAEKAARRAEAAKAKADKRAARTQQRENERLAQQKTRAEADAAEARWEAQQRATKAEKAPPKEEPAPPKVKTVLRAAETYLKTPYRFGGTTRAGIDCSGLLLVSFAEAGVKLPRTSAEQAKQGKAVQKDRISTGDVIFFATARPGRVSHAGLVVEASGGKVRFIHASTSGGVRIDELSNPYWAPRYLSARRLID